MQNSWMRAVMLVAVAMVPHVKGLSQIVSTADLDQDCLSNDELQAMATLWERGIKGESNKALYQRIAAVADGQTVITLESPLGSENLTGSDIGELLVYCKDIVTWDVIKATNPLEMQVQGKVLTFSGINSTNTYLLHSLMAKQVYLEAFNRSNVKLAPGSEGNADMMDGKCLSYQKYWGCTMMFPHCLQRPDNAICADACYEYNRRCSSPYREGFPRSEAAIKCDTYPESECAGAASLGGSALLALLSVLAASYMAA